MCGIAGVLHLDGRPASAALVRAMADAIAHRGPDGEGSYLDGPCGFGHRRLAIIDLTPGGDQPMATPDGRFVVSYNGELYNFQELRRELEAKGRQFRSRSDTEVVLQAFAEWGVAALERFNGMFALSLWDRDRQELLLARDRYGIKPLYWTIHDSTLLFGSEVKALLAHGLPARIDEEALVEYFTFQNFFTERTLFGGVQLLPPGSYATISATSSAPTIVRYWDFDFDEPAERRPDEEYLEELDHLFRQAVTRQLVSDVPVGSYLSGGMDSGAITALAAAALPELRTFTVGFDLRSASGIELGFDERAQSEHMSYLFGTEHYEMVLKAGDMERAMPRLAWHLEEPRVGQSYPNFYAAQLAGSFGKVVLSGGGGDELFGGYPWRYYRAAVNDSFDHYIDKYYAFWQRLVPTESTELLFKPMGAKVDPSAMRDVFRDVFRGRADSLTSPEDYINHSLYFEARTFLHGLLTVEDKLSMAHGLETRLPFLDNDLVDFAQHLPVGVKLGNLGDVVRLNENEPGPKTQKYFAKTRDGKLILRKLMERFVPREVSEGVKQGFSAPDATWFRGESIDYVQRRLFDDACIYEYLDRGTVLDLVQEHLDGKANRRLLIWSLLAVEEWCRTFLLEQPAQ